MVPRQGERALFASELVVYLWRFQQIMECDLMLDNEKGSGYLLDRYRQTWTPIEEIEG